jgi:tetratricopeptide (TPR) repeat protein
VAYYQLQKSDSAWADFDKAILLDAKYPEAYTARGVLKEDKEDWKGALADYNYALSIDSTFAIAYDNRGSLYFNQGDYEKAIFNWEKAIQYKPDYWEMYITLGEMAFVAKQYEKTINYIQNSIKINPYAYLLWGRLKYKQKKSKEACTHWRKSAELGSVEAEELVKKYCKAP